MSPSTPSASATCPKCGAVLPIDAPAALCPQCLLAAGLAAPSQAAGVPTTDQPPAGRFVPPTPAELAPAFPHLEILELVGSGGMGAVYKARQVHLDRLVALKILPPQLAQDPAFEERFLREARVLARLSHPHIVAVYDFGHTSPYPNPLPGGEGVSCPSPFGRGAGGEGAPPPEGEGGERTEVSQGNSRLYYFLMEYVDGTNLREVIRHGQLQPKEALAIVPQICDALQYAHDQGVVHRDIKPENILLDRQGRVKIADFGLAKIAGQPPAGEAAVVRQPFTLTATGQVMGTPHYMAPEQLRGTHDVDHRADIYSLGVVFYEMLTGELPIGKFAPPSRKVQVDVRLDEVVLRALESEPERRYQKASEVKTDVETISRQVVQAASGPASSDDFGSVEAVCRAVRWPALGLYLTGWTELMLGLIGLVWRLMSVWVGGPPLYLIESLLLVFSGVIGVLMIEAGRRMRQLQSYRFVVASSIVSLVPIHCLFLLSVPWGIWALVVLSRPDVKLAFSRHVRRRLESASAPLPTRSKDAGGTARTSYRRVVALVIAVVLVLASAWVGWTLWHMPPQSLSLSPGAESVATVREVPPSEVEKRTPGLEIYRYDVKVPPGHEVEFFSQLRIKKPEPGKHNDFGAAGVLRSDGIFELRLQKGETLNPDAKGKLRWDNRTEFGGGSTTSGGWIDDPTAALGPPFGSNRIGLGNKPLQLTAEREEYTVLVLLGWKGSRVPGVPSQYVYNPTALADAIEHGDFPHADVEFYLKVRLRKKQ